MADDDFVEQDGGAGDHDPVKVMNMDMHNNTHTHTPQEDGDVDLEPYVHLNTLGPGSKLESAFSAQELHSKEFLMSMSNPPHSSDLYGFQPPLPAQVLQELKPLFPAPAEFKPKESLPEPTEFQLQPTLPEPPNTRPQPQSSSPELAELRSKPSLPEPEEFQLLSLPPEPEELSIKEFGLPLPLSQSEEPLTLPTHREPQETQIPEPEPDYFQPRTPEEPYPEGLEFQPRTPKEPYPEPITEPEVEDTIIPKSSTLKCFFCPEISTRGRKVKRTKIHLQLDDGFGNSIPGTSTTTSTNSTPNSRLESEEYEASQGFHQLCHILSLETSQLSQNLETDYFLACAQCTQQLISLKNFIGVYSKVKDAISDGVGQICQSIMEVGAMVNSSVNQTHEESEAEIKLAGFRKAFGFANNNRNVEQDSSESPCSRVQIPIDWKLLTKQALSLKNLYNPVNFLPLAHSDSVIKVEPGTVGTYGQDWSTGPDPDALFHCQTKLEPQDYDDSYDPEENLEYAQTIPANYSRGFRGNQRQRELRAKALINKGRRNRKRRQGQGFSKSEPSEPPVCTQCNKSFSRVTGLNYHMRSVHGVGEPLERKHECEICGKTFLKPSHLTEHFRSHTGEKIHQCGYCEQRFRGTTGRKAHEESAHGVRDPSFQDTCPKCPDVTFTSSVQFRAHQRRVHPEDILHIPGDTETDPSQDTWALRVRHQREDGLSFFIKDEYSDGEEGEERNSASDDEPYNPRRGTRKRSSTSSTPKKPRARKRTNNSTTPGSESQDPSDPNAPPPPKKKRQRKKKSETPGEGEPATPKEKKPRIRKPKVKPPPLPPIAKPRVRPPAPLKVKCNYCDRMCAYESDRIRHENSVHLNIKPFLCENCGKGFNRIYQLRIHMESHAHQESGPRECPHCPGKVFKNQGFLTIHLVKMHNHEKKPQKPPVIYV